MAIVVVFVRSIAVLVSFGAVIIASANVVLTTDGEPLLRLSMVASLTLLASLIVPNVPIAAHAAVEPLATIPSHQRTNPPPALLTSPPSWSHPIASHPPHDRHDQAVFLVIFILVVSVSLDFQ